MSWHLIKREFISLYNADVVNIYDEVFVLLSLDDTNFSFEYQGNTIHLNTQIIVELCAPQLKCRGVNFHCQVLLTDLIDRMCTLSTWTKRFVCIRFYI